VAEVFARVRGVSGISALNHGRHVPIFSRYRAPLGAVGVGGLTDSSPAADSPASTSSSEPGSLSEKKDCLKLKDGHCKISFDTPALCAVCNAERMKARAA
jgi:hypothetical protein